ncbi:MAG: hypothetical protein WD407_02400 [Rhodospirillales bacterium]
MTMPKAVFFGLALIALAVVFNKEAVTQTTAGASGTYAITSSADTSVWRVNTLSGQVSYCRKEFANAPAKCGSWSTP